MFAEPAPAFKVIDSPSHALVALAVITGAAETEITLIVIPLEATLGQAPPPAKATTV